MPDRAAIVTGASRGIGRALAQTLAEEGFSLTVTARKPEGVQQAVEELRALGVEVEGISGNLADEATVVDVVSRHRARFGRLDVLVNNAGIGIGAKADEHQAKHVDLQFAVNVRTIVLFYRECAEMLRAAGHEHRNAWVVNLGSVAGKMGPAWLSVYGATKAAVISYTRSMNNELGGDGIKSVAFCPGFVDTDMADFVKEQIPADQMIRPQDLGEALRFMLRLSPGCVVPEIVFERPGDTGLLPG
jgi:NAD(P)-dependent dehydrogenase (short-subunit alcohol dehydrogenase family)